MRPKLILAAVSAVLAISLLGASGASAATEAGNRCTGNAAEEDLTLYGAANAPGNPLSATIPVSGVITRWNFNIVPVDPGFIVQTLKILRATGAPSQFRVIGESSQEPISGGSNAFSARIPVQAGDFIGTTGRVEGENEAVYCNTGNSGDRLGVINGNPPLNSTATSETEVAGVQVPITVSVEPDVDNDGYGDETQDACPQSAALQTPCPPVTLSTSTQVKKGSVTVIVTSSVAAPVTVKGVAKLGKGKKAKLNGGTQNLIPGTLNKYRLFFTKSMKNKLKELPPTKKLTLKVTVSGASVAGTVTTKTLKLKIKGQAKPSA
jgi:hypothetical protein